MTNRRKTRLYWEQLNRKHESNRILKGEVINILMLWKFCIILVEIRPAHYHAWKKKEAIIFIFNPGDVSSWWREEIPLPSAWEQHCPPQPHSPGLGMQFGGRSQWDTQAVPALMGFLGCEPTHVCPSTFQPPTKCPHGCCSPQVSCWVAHTAAQRNGGYHCDSGGRQGKQQDFCLSLLSSFSAPLWLPDDFTPCTLHASPSRAAHQCETHGFHVCIGSCSDNITNFGKKGDLLFKTHLLRRGVERYMSKMTLRWLGEPQLCYTLLLLGNTFPLNPLLPAVSSAHSYVAHR